MRYLSLFQVSGRDSVVYQKSLNVSEQNCNIYWSKVWIQFTPKLMCAIWGRPCKPPILLPKKEKPGPAPSNRELSPSAGEDCAYGLQIIRTALEKLGIFGKTADIILSAWWAGMSKAYHTYIKRWTFFLCWTGWRSFSTKCGFFAWLSYFPVWKWEKYSWLQLTRIVVGTLFIGRESVGSHPLVSPFLQGVFHRHPSLPKNAVTWDVDMVLQFLKKYVAAKFWSLQQLTLKVTVLLPAISGQRVQVVWLLGTWNIIVSNKEVCCVIGDLLKTTTPKTSERVDTLSLPPW